MIERGEGRYNLGRSVARLVRLALRLGAGHEVTSAYVRETYGVSKPTAQRDPLRLECLLPVTVERVARRGGFPQVVLRLDPQHSGFTKLLRVSAS